MTQPAQPPEPPVKESNPSASRLRILRIGAYVVAGLALLAILLGLAVVLAPPGWLARDIVARLIHEHTGRTLTVAGGSRLTLRPGIRVRFQDASLSGKPGTAEPPLVTADVAEIGLRIVDLWRWKLEVTDIVLARPAIVIAAGEPLLDRIALGEVGLGGIPARITIAEGTISVTDAAATAMYKVERVNGILSRAAQPTGMEFKGDLVARGEAFSLEGRLGDLPALAKGVTSPAKLAVQSKLAELQLEGEVATKPMARIVGKLSGRTGALAQLLTWAELDTGQANLGRSAKFEGTIAGSPRRLAVSAARLEMDALSGNVEGEVSIDEQRPSIKASLTSAKVDLDVILPLAAKPAAFAVEPLEGRVTLPTAWDSLLQAVERASAPPRSRATMEAAVRPLGDLSSEPFKLTKLPDVDVDLNVSAQQIRYSQLPVTDARLQVLSRPTRLELQVVEAALHQGNVSGRIDIDLGKGPLETAVKLKLNRLALGPLVADVLHQRVLAGTGDMELAVTGRGGSMRELVGSLDGTATFNADAGAVVGFDLRRAVLSLGASQTYNPAQQTRFDNMRAVVVVRNGVLRTTDALTLKGPEVDIASTGSLGLVSRRVDQSVRLSLKPPPLHLPVQLRVRGTLDHPSVYWDIFSAIADPTKLATPFAVGSRDERMPDTVRTAITDALAADPATTRLSPEARAFLSELLRMR